MDNPIRQIRLNVNMTQEAFSTTVGIPLKTLRNWEQGIRQPSAWTINMIIDKALKIPSEQTELIDENHGILSYLRLKQRVAEVAKRYPIDQVVLFGSYAKGQANGSSDVDLYMISDVEGLDYFGIAEDFRESLQKGVDLLSPKTVIPKSSIESEILNSGIVIYERS